MTRKFKVALIAVVAVMAVAAVSGIAVWALTNVQDTTEDTPVAVVGESAGAVAETVDAVGDAASGPVGADEASANQQTDDDEPPPPPPPTPTPIPPLPTPTPYSTQ